MGRVPEDNCAHGQDRDNFERDRIIGQDRDNFDRDIQKQETRAKVAESNHLWECKERLLREKGKEYLSKFYRRKRKEMRTRARYRLGSGNKMSKYWREHGDKICRLCGAQVKTLEHIFEACPISGKKVGKSWREIIIGGKKSLSRMMTVE